MILSQKAKINMKVSNKYLLLIIISMHLVITKANVKQMQLKHSHSPNGKMNDCFEKYFELLISDLRSTRHVSIVCSESLKLNFDFLNPLFSYTDESPWTVALVSDLSHLSQILSQTHVVWVITNSDEIDFQLLSMLTNENLRTLHIALQQPPPSSAVSLNFTFLQKLVFNKAYVLSRIKNKNECTSCQVNILKDGNGCGEGIRANPFISRLGNKGIRIKTTVKNNRKCKLNVLVREFKPYAYRDQLTGDQRGIDYYLMQMITQKLNFEVKYTIVDADTRISQLNLSRFDAIIGGMDERSLNVSSFQALMPYYQDDYTWCVARAKPRAVWKNVFYIIKDDITIVLMVVGIILTVITGLLITGFDSRPLDFWLCLCTFMRTILCEGSNYLPTKGGIRLLYELCTFISLWLSTIFLAFIFKFLANLIYERQISTVLEMADHKYRLLSPRDLINRITSKQLLQAALEHSLSECLNIDECLRQMTSSKNIAVAVSRKHIQSVISRKQAFCFDEPENLFSYSASFLMQKDFHSTQAFNTLIERFLETGLISMWASDNDRKRFNIIESTHAHSVNLSVEPLFGIFLICFVFLFLSIVAFMLELIIHRKSNVENAKRLWVLASQAIDSKRYLFSIKNKRNCRSPQRPPTSSDRDSASYMYTKRRNSVSTNEASLGTSSPKSSLEFPEIYEK